MNPKSRSSWAAEEFAEVKLGDKRLDARLIKLCDRFSDAPESPINQACADWAETKAAYRFFQNSKVEVGKMLAAHRCKTAQRIKEHETVLALQDTSYFVYTNHPKTEGLGKMSLKKGKNVKKIYSNGLIVSKRSKTKHAKERESRNATVSVRFDSFTLNAPRNNIRHSTEKLPDIEMHAVYVLETNPPDSEEAIEWMLLTNLPVMSYEDAYEKALWYCLRWRIEMYFKVLKSGFRVESCRLGHADRLAKYLTVMSIVAWRLFMITLIARTDPITPCSTFLTDQEWKALFLHANTNKPIPKEPPAISIIVIWIAKLGGYLARKSDGPPGTITLWRGWKRLVDLSEGLKLADQL